MSHNVWLLGEGPLAETAGMVLRKRGVSVWEGNTPNGEAVDAVIDVSFSGENGDRKHALLAHAESRVRPDIPIFTSCLDTWATRTAAWLKKPERVAGFSPLELAEGDIVEVSRPLQAQDETAWEGQVRLWENWGKRVEIVGDEPGLVFPRILSLMVNEAAHLLGEGGATAADIDTGMKQGTNHPRGPLEWADRVGVDQIAAILEGLQQAFGEDRYRPAPLIRKMVWAGRFGVRSGRGFHHYE
ncbi:3-hydroxyacyl-CoA dehydrogenase family protein [Desmospora profundinema]|uniref:3-hydroxybutyryl-CoA dehydrogenase n=1 Tax=Desmospora profundinema TaxID=1571184 RepID=A0ABU1IRH7_9BACL|nr:3-hydroxyacyl-CoA dehydrogenase family protein [Desmospora profundinema]MDR6226764.1 3-hydroxybutyryl-CoA dehydrogenase [Desmospora profundinema]